MYVYNIAVKFDFSYFVLVKKNGEMAKQESNKLCIEILHLVKSIYFVKYNC